MARKPPSRFKMALLAFLGLWFIRILMATVRKEFANYELFEQTRADTKTGNAILAIWHGRILLATRTHRGTDIHILISLHRDGRLIARISEGLGYKIIPGSTSRGGAQGLFKMLKALEEGHDLVVTPDGPRGPRFSVGDGCLFVARKSGLPIIPVGISASRFWQFRSWDGMIIPKPFSKIRIQLGAPLHIPADATDDEIETHRQTLRTALLDATKQADAVNCKTLPQYDPPVKRPS